jgi:hypothetical protein
MKNIKDISNYKDFLNIIDFKDLLYSIYNLLENEFNNYLNYDYLKFDPIIFPKEALLKKENNVEMIALISSTFAFGNRKAIVNFLKKLFNILDLNQIQIDLKKLFIDKKIYENFLDYFSDNVLYEKLQSDKLFKIINDIPNEEKEIFNIISNNIKILFKKYYEKIKNLKYRWLDSKIIFSYILSIIFFYFNFDNVESFLLNGKIIDNKSFFLKIEMILNFLNSFTKIFLFIIINKNENIDNNNFYFDKNFSQKLKKDFIKINSLTPSLKSSSLKRFMLFLKWCSFYDSLNLGLWNKKFQKYLLYPLDTHILNKTTFFILIILYKIDIQNYNLKKSIEKYINKNINIMNKIIFFSYFYSSNLKEINNEEIKDILLKNFETFYKKYKICLKNNLKRKSFLKNSLNDAIIITDFYKIFSKENPLKYDFCLTFL